MKARFTLLLWRYGLAILLVGLATLLTTALASPENRTILALFYAAVMISAWSGGLGPGLLAALLSALAGAYFFMPPSMSGAVSWNGLTQIGVFLLIAGLISWLNELRRRAEVALQTTAERLRLALISAKMIAWDWDLNSGRVTCSENAAEIWGTQVGSAEEFIAVIHPEDQAAVRQAAEQAVTAGGPYRSEYRIRGPDGQVRWLSSQGWLHFGPDGQPQRLIGLSTDITARKETEEKLRQSEARFRAAQDLSLDAFTILKAVRDANGQIVDFVWEYANPAAERLLLKSKNELVGRRLLEVLPNNKFNSDLFERYVRVVDSGHPHDIELYYQGEGISGWFRNMTVRLGDGVAVSFNNITQRKRIEEGQRLLAEAGKVLASSLDYKERLSNVAWLAVPHMADWCIVDVFEEDGQVHHAAVAHGDPAKVALAHELQRRYPRRREDILKENPPWFRGQAELHREISEAMIAAAAQDAEHYRILRELNLHSAMVVPLVAREQVLGVMLFVYETGRCYDEQDLALAEELARRGAIALDNARLYEAEREARAEAEANQQRLALLAEMRERNRLAQELHDTVAQALGYLNLKIGLTNTLLVNNQLDDAQATLRELKQVVSETYTDVREEIFNLRAKTAAGLGFMELLERYIDKYRRFYHLDIELIKETEGATFDFSAEVTPQLIRTIQEALINIRKHAQVDQAVIRLGRSNGRVQISVEDQGRGFDLAQVREKSSSFGLQIMRERVASVGGNLEIETVPGQGTKVTLYYSNGNSAN